MIAFAPVRPTRTENVRTFLVRAARANCLTSEAVEALTDDEWCEFMVTQNLAANSVTRTWLAEQMRWL